MAPEHSEHCSHAQLPWGRLEQWSSVYRELAWRARRLSQLFPLDPAPERPGCEVTRGQGADGRSDGAAVAVAAAAVGLDVAMGALFCLWVSQSPGRTAVLVDTVLQYADTVADALNSAVSPVPRSCRQACL